MQLHELGAPAHKRKQRVGRGGKRGTTSGRGTKGQKSRAGHVIRPAERDLIIRLPKRRGFSNKPYVGNFFSFNLEKIAAKVKPLAAGKKIVEVDQNLLKEVGLLPVDFRGKVKILGNGKVDFPMHIKNLSVSKGAALKIEQAGGTISKANSK